MKKLLITFTLAFFSIIGYSQINDVGLIDNIDFTKNEFSVKTNLSLTQQDYFNDNDIQYIKKRLSESSELLLLAQEQMFYAVGSSILLSTLTYIVAINNPNSTYYAIMGGSIMTIGFSSGLAISSIINRRKAYKKLNFE